MKFLFIFFVLLFVGCATTHIRVAENIHQKSTDIAKVLVLSPDVKAEVKYLSLPMYFDNNKAKKEIARQVLKGFEDTLTQKGYSSENEYDIFKTSLYKKYSQQIKNELKDLGHGMISEDLEYYHEKLQEKQLKKLSSPLPEEWKNYDAVIFLYGKAQLETDREFCMRWRGNIIYNTLALPAGVIALLFPFIIPIAFVGSGEVSFDKSPDSTFLNMIILDTHSRKIIYQYDYFIEKWGFSTDAFVTISTDSLESFPEKN